MTTIILDDPGVPATRPTRAAAAPGDVSFAISLPRDFRVRDMLRFHGRDPESPTERVIGRRLLRAIRLVGRPALLSIDLERRRARCRARGFLAAAPRAASEARALVRRLLGLGLDVAPFERRALRSTRLAPIVRARRGLRIPLTPTVFEGLVWAILGQQVNLPFAFRLRRRLIDLVGEPLAAAGPALTAHPTPSAVARLDYADLTRRQFSRRKAEYLIDAARLIASGGLEIEGLARRPPASVERIMTGIRGIGPWTAHYVMMRACGFADCVPVGDAGLVSALGRLHRLRRRPDAAATRRLMRPYAPHRSLATFHLWMTLGGPA